MCKFDRRYVTLVILTTMLSLVACQGTAVPVVFPDAVMTLEDKIASATSASPSVIAQEATILAYPEGWPGDWPDQPADELVELRAGTNGWTCIPDDRTTPGNDPMCLNETMLGYLKARFDKIDPPFTGVGIGHMLQEGIPKGSPPHMMIFVPESRESVRAFLESGSRTTTLGHVPGTPLRTPDGYHVLRKQLTAISRITLMPGSGHPRY